jgi:hypothetical protein
MVARAFLRAPSWMTIGLRISRIPTARLPMRMVCADVGGAVKAALLAVGDVAELARERTSTWLRRIGPAAIKSM